MDDLVLRNVRLIDGTGAPARTADVGVTGDRITTVGDHDPDRPAARVVEGRGRVLAPGFIDLHTHSDLTFLADGLGESKLLQGVTTEVTGNCSFAPFPIEPTHLALHVDHLSTINFDHDPAGLDVHWNDFDGYARALTDAGLGINVAPLAGHGTLRVAAMGVDDRPATPAELGRMRRDLATALEQGAWGMSTGLTLVPSTYGSVDEVIALAAVLAEAGALYATHGRTAGTGRGPGGIEEAVAVGRATGVSVQQSHMAINDPARWGSAAEQLAILDTARTEGVDIFHDVYPYIASSSALTQYLPSWLLEGGTAAMRGRAADPAQRARALTDMHRGWFGGIPWLWDRFMVSAAPDGRGVGQTLAQLAAERGADPYELTLDLCVEYGHELHVVLFYRVEEDVEAFLAHPLATVASDGNAMPMAGHGTSHHPRSYGTFPRVLGRYVRERGTLPLVDAIRKMTGEPARRLGMQDRGTVVVGNFADLVLFDPAVVADRADFGRPPQAPVGIDVVLVNGTVMVDHGTVSDSRPGSVLRKL
ncbi:MAG TPA: D-aminoacylase [Acidimicrobiia bacterium]|nr:D-aminoacylase [Acidimicrobiia bacterium]